MAVKPIIFSASMVKALLAGTKTQTRRILKPASVSDQWPGTMWPIYIAGKRAGESNGTPEIVALPAADGGVVWYSATHYLPGDVLYVREAWTQACELDEDDKPATEMMSYYRADGEPFSRYLDPNTDQWRDGVRWTPAIHMPRSASRLTLAVRDVRVQRLQDISEDDAEREGAEPILVPPDGGSAPHYEGFRALWNSINGPTAWDENPWIVALTFTVHRQNVDTYLKATANAR